MSALVQDVKTDCPGTGDDVVCRCVKRVPASRFEMGAGLSVWRRSLHQAFWPGLSTTAQILGDRLPKSIRVKKHLSGVKRNHPRPERLLK